MYKFTIFLAGSNNWGENASNWLTRQITTIALAVMAFIMLTLIVKKNWAGLVTTLLSGGIALYFVFNPAKLVAIGDTIYGIVIGG
jgi:Na+/citrate or Na+/malate symporter